MHFVLLSFFSLTPYVNLHPLHPQDALSQEGLMARLDSHTRRTSFRGAPTGSDRPKGSFSLALAADRRRSRRHPSRGLIHAPPPTHSPHSPLNSSTKKSFHHVHIPSPTHAQANINAIASANASNASATASAHAGAANDPDAAPHMDLSASVHSGKGNDDSAGAGSVGYTDGSQSDSLYDSAHGSDPHGVTDTAHSDTAHNDTTCSGLFSGVAHDSDSDTASSAANHPVTSAGIDDRASVAASVAAAVAAVTYATNPALASVLAHINRHLDASGDAPATIRDLLLGAPYQPEGEMYVDLGVVLGVLEREYGVVLGPAERKELVAEYADVWMTMTQVSGA